MTPQKRNSLTLEVYQEALYISREVGDREWEAITLNNIGLVYNNIGQPESALKYYQQASPILREVGDIFVLLLS